MKQGNEDIDGIVAYKARKAAANRAFQLIRQMTDNVQQEKSLERAVILPAFVVLMLITLDSILLLG